jgi:thiol-disulfide isomerase/thioredoxin
MMAMATTCVVMMMMMFVRGGVGSEDGVTMSSSSSSSSSSNGGGGAIEMAAEDLERYLSTTSARAVVGVKFYAPWCGHCKTVAPEWDAFAASSATSERVIVLKTDGSKPEAKDLMKRFNIRGFPTIFFFGDGELAEFSGERTREGFDKFARRGRKIAKTRRKYAYDEASGKIMFAKPSLKLRVIELVRDGVHGVARVASAQPGILFSVFIIGIWIGAFAVGIMFFLSGDWSAAANWRDHVKRAHDKANAVERAAGKKSQ